MVQNIRFGIPNVLRYFGILNMVVLCAQISLRKTVINFLQDETQEANLDSAGQSETDNMEAHFAKLNLDDEELIVMESCHSYFHDILRKMGPTNAMDARLQQEMESFPPEAKVKERQPDQLVLTSGISESHPEVWWIQKLHPQIEGSGCGGQNCGGQSRSEIGSRNGI